MFGLDDESMLGTSLYKREELDFYPTPPEATQVIADYFRSELTFYSERTVWEPAAGDGAMVDVLRSNGFDVFATDIKPRASFIGEIDFLKHTVHQISWNAIITNPPYGDDAEKFVWAALRHLENGTARYAAFLMRHEYDTAKGRMKLFCHPFFSKKIVLTWRPRWIKDSTGAPRHSYAWYVWSTENGGYEPTISYASKPVVQP